MVSIWLYSSDGRALYLVAIGTPMPVHLVYGGVLFVWNQLHNRYESQLPVAHDALPGQYPEAKPEQFPYTNVNKTPDVGDSKGS